MSRLDSGVPIQVVHCLVPVLHHDVKSVGLGATAAPPAMHAMRAPPAAIDSMHVTTSQCTCAGVALAS